MATASESATSSNGSALRRHWTALVGIATLIAIIALVVIVPGLRALAADTWREMIAIRPAYLAVIVALKIAQSLFSALIWRNALLAGWPQTPVPFRLVLGLDQGQDAVNSVAPARAGTWAMLGMFVMSIPGARAPKMLAVWAVQSLAFGLFAAINYTIVAVGLPNRTQQGGHLTEDISGFVSGRPVASAGIAAVIIALAIVIAIKGRRSLRDARRQVREGFAILGTPSRYIRMIFLPTRGSFLCRVASSVAMLAAFGIPISIWTVALALSAQSIAGAVRITPGGIGITQAIDVIALRDYAPAETVTAYSLAGFAISAIVSFSLAVIALLSVNGWHGTLHLVRQRDPSATGLHPAGTGGRSLRHRASRDHEPTANG